MGVILHSGKDGVLQMNEADSAALLSQVKTYNGNESTTIQHSFTEFFNFFY